MLLALLVACRAADDGGRADAPVVPARAEFGALQAALAAGDAGRATALIDELATLELAREERSQLEAARNVLRGRELVAGLELRLSSEESSTQAGLLELVLRAENRTGVALTLALPPADLKRHRASIDARGAEGLEFDSTLCTVLAGLELAPGAHERLVLLTYELPLGRALAVRERWALSTRSGEVRAEGRRYPAAEVAVRGCARERVSPLLGSELPPTALVEALEREPAADARTLLATALRIPPERRAEALQLLDDPVGTLARRAPERVLAAEPALRWFTGNREVGADAQGWARFLALQSDATEREVRPRLDLPAGRD